MDTGIKRATRAYSGYLDGYAGLSAIYHYAVMRFWLWNSSIESPRYRKALVNSLVHSIDRRYTSVLIHWIMLALAALGAWFLLRTYVFK